MNDPEKPIDNRILVDAVDEVKAMGRDGMAHPSTKPVLVAAAAGGIAGAVLPILSVPVGILAGAVIMLYKRIRP
jgi:hypothetical protein